MEQSDYRRRTYTPEENAIIPNCIKEPPDDTSGASRQIIRGIVVLNWGLQLQTFERGDIAGKGFNRYKRKRQ